MNRYRHLPHLDLPEQYQFVTFRTSDSLDEYLQKIYGMRLDERKKQYAIDDHLDNSRKGNYLTNQALKYLYDFLLLKDGELYQLIAFSIMPKHVHLLFKPMKELSKIMKILKGNSAKEINRILNRNGSMWARDYYDRAIRNEKHFELVYDYIKNNPSKLALCSRTEVPIPEERFYGVFE